MGAKYKVEYEVDGTAKKVGQEIVTLNKKATFSSVPVVNANSSTTTINWDNGNIQKLTLNYTIGTTWLSFSNPGSGNSRFTLFINQPTSSVITDVKFMVSNIDWLTPPPEFAAAELGRRCMITFSYDAADARYRAKATPWYMPSDNLAKLTINVYEEVNFDNEPREDMVVLFFYGSTIAGEALDRMYTESDGSAERVLIKGGTYSVRVFMGGYPDEDILAINLTSDLSYDVIFRT